MITSNKTQEKIFILDSEASFRLAEKFKAQLENDGYRVTTEPYTSNGVRVKGVNA